MYTLYSTENNILRFAATSIYLSNIHESQAPGNLRQRLLDLVAPRVSLHLARILICFVMMNPDLIYRINLFIDTLKNIFINTIILLQKLFQQNAFYTQNILTDHWHCNIFKATMFELIVTIVNMF